MNRYESDEYDTQLLARLLSYIFMMSISERMSDFNYILSMLVALLNGICRVAQRHAGFDKSTSNH